MNEIVPFNKPYMTGRELSNIAQAHINCKLAGDGPFTMRCHEALQQRCGTPKALLTHSCTAALELAALLLELGPGDEVIMPSYTFVSTANCVVLRGAKPVFVDIRDDTMNLDERLVEACITPKTRAIIVVHYAGVVCEMDAILEIARRHRLVVVEDAAQALLSTYHGRMAGSIGDLGAVSFHETKNIHAGEGGAVLVNREDWIAAAEILREKGTNRSLFFRGEVDKYTWCGPGSSFLPGELTAAFLWAQLTEMEAITARRRAIWNRYHEAFEALEARGRLRRPTVPPHCLHNAHMYYLLLPNIAARTAFIRSLKNDGIHAVFHYVPLHDSPFGRRLAEGRVQHLPVTEANAQCLVRLPLWIGLEEHQDRVIDRVNQFFQ